MKTLTTAAFGAVLLTTIASPGQAQTIVVWETIKGIAQASDVIGGVAGSGTPWSTREGGGALVELTSGQVEFAVVGLVRAGGAAIGTPGAFNQVKGTLVCGPDSATPKVIDTPLVALSAQGNAQFAGSFSSSTAACSHGRGLSHPEYEWRVDRQRLRQSALTSSSQKSKGRSPPPFSPKRLAV